MEKKKTNNNNHNNNTTTNDINTSNSLRPRTRRRLTSMVEPPLAEEIMEQEEEEEDSNMLKLSPSSSSSYPLWHNAVSGGVAGAGARLCTAPLDLIRIRAQLERNVTYPRPSLWSSFASVIHNEGGIVALFRGGVAATYLWIGYSTVQFAVYGRTKRYLGSTIDIIKDEDQHPTAIAFVSGATAGLCATLATYPFDICRTIFAARGLPQHSLQNATATTTTTTFKPPKSLYEFAISLYQSKGIKAFYAGSGPASIQIMPYMGLNFAIYDTLTSGDKAVGSSAYAGTISGATSKMIVYPLDTVKRRLQAQAVFGAGAGGVDEVVYTGMVDCFTKMTKKEGITSLYRGLLPSVLKTAIATGLSFSLYRASKNLLERVHDDWDGGERHEKQEQLQEQQQQPHKVLCTTDNGR